MLEFLRAERLRRLNRRLVGDHVFASRDIVSRGEYVARGSTGAIRRVISEGEYEVRFDGSAAGPIRVVRNDVELSPRTTLRPAMRQTRTIPGV